MPKTQSTLCILSSVGDTRVAWCPEEVEAGDKEARAAVKEAERIFDRERKNGNSAFLIPPNGDPAVRIDKFDPQAQEIMIIPRMVGG